MAKDDQDYDLLLEEVTDKYFAKCNAIDGFFGFLDDLPLEVRKQLLDTFANATGPKYLADIADDLRWLIDGDGPPLERRNLFRLVLKEKIPTDKP